MCGERMRREFGSVRAATRQDKKIKVQWFTVKYWRTGQADAKILSGHWQVYKTSPKAR
jgi:hypothetical protein